MKYIHNGPLALAVALLAIGTILPLNLGALALLTLAGYIIYRANADDVKRSDVLEAKLAETDKIADLAHITALSLKATCDELAAKLEETNNAALNAAAHAQQVDQKVSAKAFIR